MNNILVLYKSKYGSTKKYMDILQKNMTCDVFEINDFDFQQIHHYDLILFAGGIYASGIAVMKYIKKHIDILTHKKCIIFAVGASPYDENALISLKEHNFKNIPFDIPLFYGRGGYNETQMNFVDKTLCQLLKKSLRKKGPQTYEPWMKAFFEADGKSCDWVDISYLQPVINSIKACKKL